MIYCIGLKSGWEKNKNVMVTGIARIDIDIIKRKENKIHYVLRKMKFW